MKSAKANPYATLEREGNLSWLSSDCLKGIKEDPTETYANPILTKIFFMGFSFSAAQIAAAQQLFIAMAFREVIEKIFENMENDILRSREYHINDDFYTETWKKRGLLFPEDKIIRDRKDITYMSGRQYYGTPEYENTDSYRFFDELNRQACDAGLVHGENARCMSENDVLEMENKLIVETYGIHRLMLNDIIMIEDRRKLIDLLLKLFTPFVENSSLETNMRKHFDERIKPIVL